MKPRFLLLLLVLLAGVVTAHAQVIFSVTGTAVATGNGYTAGQDYTFVFMTGTTFASNSSSTFDATVNDWQEEYLTDSQLWTTIGGNAITGTYVRPSANNSDPYSRLRTYDPVYSNELLLLVDANTTTDLGLRTLGGDTIAAITISLGNVTSFAFDQSYAEPTTYFSAYLGTHTPTYQNEFSVYLESGSSVSFTATSVTISAVPEPATWGALSGVVMLLGIVFHRRRLRQ